MSNRKKIAMISGIGAGIGKLTAQRLLSLGNTILGVDRIDKDKIAPEFLENREFHYYKTNLLNKAEVEELFQKVNKEFGKLDILLNIAGGFQGVLSFEETDEKKWDDILALNLKSVYYMCSEAVPILTIRP